MWDTWFARLPAGILKMPDLALEYFEYLRPIFSLKSLLGLLFIKEAKGTSEQGELEGCFSGSEKVEQIKPASCSVHTTLFRATWSLGAAHPSVSCPPGFSLSSQLPGLSPWEFQGKNCTFLGLAALSLCPAQSSPMNKDPPMGSLCISAACLFVNEVSLILVFHFIG